MAAARHCTGVEWHECGVGDSGNDRGGETAPAFGERVASGRNEGRLVEVLQHGAFIEAVSAGEADQTPGLAESRDLLRVAAAEDMDGELHQCA